MHKTCQERYRTAGSHQAQLLYPPLLGVRLPLLASRQLFIVQIHDYCPHMSMAMFLSHNGKHEAKQGLLGHVQSGDPEIHHIYPRLPRSTSVLGACSFQRLLFLLIICHSVGMSLISSPLQGRHQKDQSRCPGIHFLCASASLRLTQTNSRLQVPWAPFSDRVFQLRTLIWLQAQDTPALTSDTCTSSRNEAPPCWNLSASLGQGESWALYLCIMLPVLNSTFCLHITAATCIL